MYFIETKKKLNNGKWKMESTVHFNDECKNNVLISNKDFICYSSK